MVPKLLILRKGRGPTPQRDAFQATNKERRCRMLRSVASFRGAASAQGLSGKVFWNSRTNKTTT